MYLCHYLIILVSNKVNNNLWIQSDYSKLYQWPDSETKLGIVFIPDLLEQVVFLGVDGGGLLLRVGPPQQEDDARRAARAHRRDGRVGQPLPAAVLQRRSQGESKTGQKELQEIPLTTIHT